jgi:DNA-binding response OmpR family regulator
VSMKLKVMVAEHEADVLTSTVHSLKIAGYEIIPTTTGLQALKQACARLPNLIILDALLPDIDGPAVCEILQRLPSTASIPIILLTSSPGEVQFAVGAERGANGYLAKPFKAAKLVLMVNEILLRREEENLAEGDLEPTQQFSRHEA